MRHSLVFLAAAALAAQTPEPEAAPEARGFEYAQLWFGDRYTVGVGINAQQYTRAVICYFRDTGCRFDFVEVRRYLADNEARFYAQFLTQDAVAKAAAILGKQGWKLVSTTEDQKLGLTLLFRRREPRPN